MVTKLNEAKNRPDYILVLIVVALVLLGLIMVYSSTFALGYTRSGQPTYYLVRQAVWAAMGLDIMALMMRAEYHKWQKFSIVFMLLTLLLLVYVLLVGPQVHGARRRILGDSIQPSEICKLAMVLYIAHWLSSKGEKLKQVTYGLVPFAILIGIIAGLIILEPDFGTTILIVATAGSMFFIAGADLIQLVISAMVGSSTLLLIIANYEYAWNRLVAFSQDPFSALQNPFNNTLAQDTYQVMHTLVTLGSGGITGVGLGTGQQKGLLPAAESDAIFAVLGEELGLIGCLTVLSLFAALAYRGFKIALRAEDSFGFILASGITIWLTFQALINIAVVTDTLPFTGLPLPFISLGGSSLVISMMGVGVLLSISRGTREKTQEHDAPLGFRGRNGGARVPHPGRPAAAD
ncbi:MAG: putative lipid II flippase FtsW [Chloroflexi bacterium B3_Chlor]|nr:MAG: putative lipid II flippase FtsW [Chloroflexi bacterium B3_Chlor]